MAEVNYALFTEHVTIGRFITLLLHETTIGMMVDYNCAEP